MDGRPSSEPNEVGYDIPPRKIQVHPLSEWQETPIDLPPRRSQRGVSRSSKQLVTPSDRERIERTRQLAKAFQESARIRGGEKFCKYVREHPAEDAWGTEFKVECWEPIRSLVLQSAGPDHMMGTPDDVKWTELRFDDRDSF